MAPRAEAVDGPARLGVPVGSAQAGEGRHHVHALGPVHAAGDGRGFGHVVDDAQVVAQPLHERAGHEHAALERVLGTRAGARRGDGGDEVVGGTARFAARVHEQEAAGAVRVLRLAGLEAALPEQGRLLIARHAADGHVRHDAGGGRAAELPRRGAHVGKQRRRDVEQVEQPRVPPQFVDVVQHGAAGVRHIGGVHAALRERPDEPRVHGAEGELAGFGVGAGAFHVVEDPLDLAGGEVGVGHETRLVGDGARDLGVGGELVDDGRRAAALPHDGVHHGLPRFAIPHHGGLALVRDADAVDVVRGEVVRHEQLGERTELGRQNVARVVFHPSRLGVDLRKRVLHRIDDVTERVDEHGARRGGSLIERYDVLWHACSSIHVTTSV